MPSYSKGSGLTIYAGNAAPPQPAWLSTLALSVGQWGAIPGTNLSAVPPSPVPNGNTGPSSKIVAWTSFAIHPTTSKVYSVANGGDLDYSGNEVNLLDLSVDSPAWSEILAPTAAADVVSVATHYNDGRPTSRHTYYGVATNVTDDRIHLIGGVVYGGQTGAAHDSYNIGANSYTTASTHPNVSATVRNLSAFACCRDSSDNIIAWGNNVIERWLQSTNAWTQLRTGAPLGYGAASAWDSTRSRMFILGGTQADSDTYAPGTDTLAAQTLTGAEAANVLGTGNGMVYVPSLDAYLLRKSGSGGAVYKIDASTFECTDFGTTGGASIPATSNGPYNKFLYAPALGVVVYCPSYTGNAWALKVH